jgi:hypothetical protein
MDIRNFNDMSQLTIMREKIIQPFSKQEEIPFNTQWNAPFVWSS